eukprot:5937896-Pleurochrysis_carterae.AAC.1
MIAVLGFHEAIGKGSAKRTAQQETAHASLSGTQHSARRHARDGKRRRAANGTAHGAGDERLALGSRHCDGKRQQRAARDEWRHSARTTLRGERWRKHGQQTANSGV